MNFSRRALLIAAPIAMAPLAGCMTSRLLKDEPKQYSEEVTSVMISEDATRLVVFTEKHHYVFDANALVVATLRSTFRPSVRAAFGTLRIDSSGELAVPVELTLPASASDSDKRMAIEKGYSPTSEGGVRAEVLLKGTKYTAGTVTPARSAIALNQTYKVKVLEEPSTAEKAGRVLLTPITLAADGVLLIGAVPLVLFAGAMVGLSQANLR